MTWRIALVVGVLLAVCDVCTRAVRLGQHLRRGAGHHRSRPAGRGRHAHQRRDGLERQAVTNEAGLYTFPNVPVGDYQITATLSGFKPITKTGVHVNAGRQHPRRRSARARRAQRDDPGRGGDDAGRHVGDRPHRARRADRRHAAQRTPRLAGRAAGARRRRRQHGRLGADGRRHVRDRHHVDQRRPRRRVHDDDRRRSVDPRPRRRRLHDGRAELRHRRRSAGADDELSGRVRPLVGGPAAAGHQERHAELPRQRVLESSERRARREHAGRASGRDLEKSPHNYNAYGFTLGGPIYIPGAFNSNKQSSCSSSGARSGSAIARSRNRPAIVPTAAMRNGDFSELLLAHASSRPADRTRPFPGNIIPQDRISPQGRALLNAYPAADSRIPAGREQLDRQPVGLQQPAQGQHQDRLRADVQSSCRGPAHLGAERLERSRAAWACTRRSGTTRAGRWRRR